MERMLTTRRKFIVECPPANGVRERTRFSGESPRQVLTRLRKRSAIGIVPRVLSRRKPIDVGFLQESNRHGFLAFEVRTQRRISNLLRSLLGLAGKRPGFVIRCSRALC
jgi:hypothetical protein